MKEYRVVSPNPAPGVMLDSQHPDMVCVKFEIERRIAQFRSNIRIMEVEL